MIKLIQHYITIFICVSGMAFAATPEITSPPPGGVYQGHTLNLNWKANGNAITYYYLFVGSRKGGNDILSQWYRGNTLSATVNIPTGVDKVYVKFWYVMGGWRSNSYEYSKAKGEPVKGNICNYYGETLYTKAIKRQLAQAGALGNVVTRWKRTATNSDIKRGDPITLTWSIVPDGTKMMTYAGEPDNGSDLRARLTQLFGDEETWMDIMREAFDDWGKKTGIKFVYSEADDGGMYALLNILYVNHGKLGVRGDIRIGGHPIDGYQGIMAYTMFPDSGDMVIDTGDTVYTDPGVDKKKLFKQIFAHELGHALGLGHVCPRDNTKLMETETNEIVLEPSLDEIIVAQRLYGDPFDNNTVETAKDLGVAKRNVLTIDNVAIDGDTDRDFYKFTLAEASKVRITVSPFGKAYEVGVVDGNTGACNDLKMHDTRYRSPLKASLSKINERGGRTSLGSSGNRPSGHDALISKTVEEAGEYYVQVWGRSDACQQYVLNIESVPSRSPYQNPDNKYDVNQDGSVTPRDALNVINEISRSGSRKLPMPQDPVPMYFDVTGDGHISPVDALNVINEIKRRDMAAAKK